MEASWRTLGADWGRHLAGTMGVTVWQVLYHDTRTGADFIAV